MRSTKRVGTATLLIAAILFGTAGSETVERKNSSMETGVLIEWTKTQDTAIDEADIVVYEDGEVVLSERLGGGRYRLDAKQRDELRAFVFQEQRLADIDEQALNRERADAVAKAPSSSEAVVLRKPQMDSGTTFIRSNTGGQPYSLRYHDLVGDVQAFPGIEDLQRLRRIELKLLELVDTLTRP
jgi:hypothetical protein